MKPASCIRYFIVGGAIALLEIACRTGLIGKRVIIPPSAMASSLLDEIRSGNVVAELVHTYISIGAAFALSVIVGVLCALVIHAFPRLRRGLEPFFATYYAVPIFIFYPVLISILGVSRLPIVLMAFALAVVAVIMAMLNALDRQPRVLRKIAAVHHMGWYGSVMRLSLPAAAPHLFTGIKLAIAYSFIGVLACEFLLSSVGIGHAISFSYNAFDNDRMYGLILLVIVMVIAINSLLQACEQYLLRRQTGGTRGIALARAGDNTGRLAHKLDVVLIVVVLLAVWQMLHWLTGANALSAPLDSLLLLIDMLQQERFWMHVQETARALAVALLIAYGAGVVLGAIIGMSRLLTEAVEPILVALYALPKVTILPVVLLMFGIGIASKIAFGVMHSMLPIMLFTIGAIRKIRPIYLKMAKTMRLSSTRTIIAVAIPAALPEIVTGLRVGFPLTLLGVLIGEMFASKRGLGYLIMNSMGSGDVKVTMSVAIFLFTIAGLANTLLLRIDRPR